MDRTKPINRILKWTVIFCFVYALLWLFPVIVVYPADTFLEFYKSTKFVGGWTPGVTVWGITVIVLPILFGLAMLALYFRARKLNGAE